MSPKVIVGMMGSSVAKGSSLLSTPEGTAKFLNVLKAHGVNELDTARVYNGGQSESLLGQVAAAESFKIATKAPGFTPGSLSYDNVMKNCKLSFEALNQPKIDLYYFHGPDFETPLEESCRAIGELYRQGRFERFGVSNLNPTQVQEVYDICKREGYPLPTVYQGAYNPIARGPETSLFPLLKKLGIAFYAYSPAAGGLLAKPIQQILEPAEGSRFKAMPVFGQMYLRKPFLDGLKKINELCDEEGITLMEANMRWFMHHSVLGKDDGFLLGASTIEQIEQSLGATEKGPLPEKLAQGWEDLWQGVVEADAVQPGWPSEGMIKGSTKSGQVPSK